MNRKILKTIQLGKIKRKTSANYVCEIDTDDGTYIGLIPLQQARRFKIGDFIEGFITKPVLTPTGIQYVMSRGEDYITCLCGDIIPVINSGRVKVEKVVREPGVKIKIAVALSDEFDTIKNAAAVVVGKSGEYITALKEHLDNEYIDIINWTNDLDSYIANALTPAEVIKIDCDPNTRTAKAMVPKKQMGLALGKNGSNVRLASELTDYLIKVYAAGEDYLDQFNFPDWVRNELEAANIVDSDALIELYESNNQDRLISKKAFQIILSTIDFEEENEPNEDEDDDFYYPICGEKLPRDMDLSSKSGFKCPHCGADLVIEDDD